MWEADGECLYPHVYGCHVISLCCILPSILAAGSATQLLTAFTTIKFRKCLGFASIHMSISSSNSPAEPPPTILTSIPGEENIYQTHATKMILSMSSNLLNEMANSIGMTQPRNISISDQPCTNGASPILPLSGDRNRAVLAFLIFLHIILFAIGQFLMLPDLIDSWRRPRELADKSSATPYSLPPGDNDDDKRKVLQKNHRDT